jgi:hypothetical protein
MREEIYLNIGPGISIIQEVIEVVRVLDEPTFRRYDDNGSLIEERAATDEETGLLLDEERETKIAEARANFLNYVEANQGTDLGQALKNLLIALRGTDPGGDYIPREIRRLP